MPDLSMLGAAGQLLEVMFLKKQGEPQPPLMLRCPYCPCGPEALPGKKGRSVSGERVFQPGPTQVMEAGTGSHRWQHRHGWQLSHVGGLNITCEAALVSCEVALVSCEEP